MTNFNPQGDFKSIEAWEAIALNKAGQNGVAAKVIGGILAGGLGVTLGVEILGGIAAAWLIKSAWDALTNAGKRLQVARDMGCNAFVLDERLFNTYVRQFGQEVVATELNTALNLGCELSPSAQDWLDQQNNQKQITPTQEVKQITKKGITRPASAPTSNPTSTSIFTPAAPTPIPNNTPVKTVTNTYNPLEGSKIDIIAEVTNHIQNIICVGQGGSGKGMLIANAMRAVKEQHHGKKIFVINGKDSIRELGYFDGVADAHEKLHCETAKPSTVAAWFEAAIAKYHQFSQLNDGALLVIDEGTIIGAKLKTANCSALNDVVLGITSCGDEQGKNVWLCVQTPYVTAGGIDKTTASQLTSIILVKASGIGVLTQWKQASLFSAIGTEEATELAANSDCNRAVFWGGKNKWYSMPKLINYSSFDRDTRTVIRDTPPSKDQLEKLLDLDSEQPIVIQPDDDGNSDDSSGEFNQELADCIFDKIVELNHASFDTLRKHAQRNFSDNNITNSEVRMAIQSLIEQEIISGNEEYGYSLT